MTTLTGLERGIFAAAYTALWQAGWRGVLPLPRLSKKPVPEGWTGRRGAWPSYPDLVAWGEDRPLSNVALRLPENVIGIDVDAYPGKTGRASLEALERLAGSLPPTWTTTSRSDGISGIRLYRVPEGLAWPGIAGPSIEIIQCVHRYAVVAPSVHPDTLQRYRWLGPDGQVVTQLDDSAPPTPDDLAVLPQAWIERLTGGVLDSGVEKADLNDAQIAEWLRALREGPQCPAVRHALTRRITELLGGVSGSRHETALEGSARLVRLGAQGHRGVGHALDELRLAFSASMRGDVQRERDAPSEWTRMISGAVRVAVAGREALGSAAVAPVSDPCESGPSDLLPSSPTATSLDPPPPPTLAPVVDGDRAERSSWAGVDWDQLLGADGEPDPEPEQPTFLSRDDGVCLFYAGRVHDIHGEPESGKSFVALAAVAQTLTRDGGQPVLYVDHESDPASVVARLRGLGVERAAIRAWLTYVRPEQSPYTSEAIVDWTSLLDRFYGLAIIDGVTEALVQYGAATKDNDTITSWFRRVPRRIADLTGAAVVVIDHVTKSVESRGRFAIGGQAKLAALDGASYLAEMTQPMGIGMRGEVTLRLAKDRPGTLRAHCGPSRPTDRTQEVARLVFDSDEKGRISLVVDGPSVTQSEQQEESTTRRQVRAQADLIRLTGLMEKLSRQIETEPGKSRRGVVASYRLRGGQAKTATIQEALTALIGEGNAVVTYGARNATLVAVARPYRQADDPASERYREPLESLNGVLHEGNRRVTRHAQGPTNATTVTGRNVTQLLGGASDEDDEPP
jgi:hypothetical protein